MSLISSVRTLTDCSLDATDAGDEQQSAMAGPSSAPESLLSWHVSMPMSTVKSSARVNDPSEGSCQLSFQPGIPETTSRAQSTRLAIQKTTRTRSATSDVGKFCCWEHGCNGRRFATRGNLVRHCVERSESRRSYGCARCGAKFSRVTARNQHITKKRCGRRRDLDHSST